MLLTQELASRLAHIALGHVTREWPNKLDHVMGSPGDVKLPSELHPVFYGSFDWHSCVHGYWLLARLLRRFPEMRPAPEIVAVFDRQLTDDKIAGEIAYLARPEARGFERPYGWAWALMLACELLRHDTPHGKRWAASLRPLGAEFASRFCAYLPLADYPVRVGVHSNTAFALLLAFDYAAIAPDSPLETLCRQKMLSWYGQDKDCQAWEPSGDDFLSPALTEAAAVSCSFSNEAFRRWLAKFLPRAAAGEPATLFAPARVSDRSDGKIAHLDGLNLSRAWCWRRIAACLDREDPLFARAEAAALAHSDAALPHVSGDYAGEHWLASFALLALDPWPDG